MGSEAIYLVDGEGGFGELERAIEISVLGIGREGGGTFGCDIENGDGWAGRGQFEEQWLQWLENVFRDQVSEVFMRVYLAAAEMRIEQMVELDNSLDTRLGPGMARRSREAGQCFLEGKGEMRRASQWKKYTLQVEQGKSPGHLATVFALQAALYHLPLLSALSAYVYFEWSAAKKSLVENGGLAEGGACLRGFLQQCPESVDIVREVFGRNLQEWRAISGE